MHRKTILGRTADECKDVGQATNGPPGQVVAERWHASLGPANTQDLAWCRGASHRGNHRPNPYRNVILSSGNLNWIGFP
jgi:hypothetical protein